MSVIRYIVIGIVLAGVLAGIGALAEHGIPASCASGVLIIGSVYVGARMIGGLFSRSSDPGPIALDGPLTTRPEFKIIRRGTDFNGNPYVIIQGDAQDAAKFTEGRTYPASMGRFTHTHLGHYRWKIHVENQ